MHIASPSASPALCTATEVDAHRPLLLRIVRGLGVPPQVREDALQGAALGYLEAKRRFDPTRGTTIGAYARGFIIKEIKRATSRLRPTPAMDSLDARPSSEGHDVVDRSELPVADRVEGLVEKEAVRRAIDQLTTDERHLYERLFVDQVPQVEVARELGLTAMSLSRRKSALIVRLKHILMPAVQVAS